jgi:hypothetical protein
MAGDQKTTDELLAVLDHEDDSAIRVRRAFADRA